MRQCTWRKKSLGYLYKASLDAPFIFLILAPSLFCDWFFTHHLTASVYSKFCGNFRFLGHLCLKVLFTFKFLDFVAVLVFWFQLWFFRRFEVRLGVHWFLPFGRSWFSPWVLLIAFWFSSFAGFWLFFWPACELAGKGQNTQAGNCSNFQQPPAETGSESCEKSAENVDGQNRELNRLQGQPTLQPNNDGADGQETQAEVQADGPFIEVVNRKNEAGRRKNSTHVQQPQVSTIQGCHMRNLKVDSSSTVTGSFSKNVTNEKLKDIADKVRRARKLSEKKKGISLASSS
ncbi:Hypothetical predicted protein [Olea europaea subsp. europaea]|uniref:Uncharacterized protein n=1 Tax=Olea europaea subsp. europaea TaxID=158383 RepID=A0A8S0Q5K2_OLEEU|nr:Hypothetical predicted protein [Olea europaea subsp. europaea]